MSRAWKSFWVIGHRRCTCRLLRSPFFILPKDGPRRNSWHWASDSSVWLSLTLAATTAVASFVSCSSIGSFPHLSSPFQLWFCSIALLYRPRPWSFADPARSFCIPLVSIRRLSFCQWFMRLSFPVRVGHFWTYRSTVLVALTFFHCPFSRFLYHRFFW
jgi:hypothetical protein